jgi:hypothetical protein
VRSELATVQELKDALEVQRELSIALSERSMAAIDTLLGLSTWAFGILAFVVGIIAIFGYSLIHTSAKRAAQKVAKDGFNDYLKSREFADLLEAGVRIEVKERMKDKIILSYMTEDATANGEDAFPVAVDGKSK